MKEQIMAVQRMQDYIRRLRLAKAALQIKNEHIRMIDAAFDLGFGSVDGVTRAFTREFEMCPQAFQVVSALLVFGWCQLVTE